MSSDENLESSSAENPLSNLPKRFASPAEPDSGRRSSIKLSWKSSEFCRRQNDSLKFFPLFFTFLHVSRREGVFSWRSLIIEMSFMDVLPGLKAVIGESSPNMSLPNESLHFSAQLPSMSLPLFCDNSGVLGAGLKFASYESYGETASGLGWCVMNNLRRNVLISIMDRLHPSSNVFASTSQPKVSSQLLMILNFLRTSSTSRGSIGGKVMVVCDPVSRVELSVCLCDGTSVGTTSVEFAMLKDTSSLNTIFCLRREQSWGLGTINGKRF